MSSHSDYIYHQSLRAAIIDLDGTMVDTLDDFVVAINQTLSQLALDLVDRAFIEHTIGKGPEYLIRSVLDHVGADAVLYGRSLQLYRQHYQEVNGRHAKTYPGVAEGLSALKARNLRLACLTNKPTAFALSLLKQLELNHYFDMVFGGDTFERTKPDPLPLIKTCEMLNTAPSQTLVIGDSDNDALAARAAGCPVILVSYGYNHGKPVDAVDADGVIDRLDQIDRLLIRHLYA
ncbi:MULTISPECIES: phosphoglycolate phosphatase [Ralstonia solanacearum species complex]|uniref:phosphoglycolate phosphatase n=1 Tax=Ralstonia solanacearum species complex TaxID=3116862 RepID=UPI00078DE7AA|nr:phosphoglycolate phosphatase [Ralstonia solanacearum]BEU72818.1 phosphoglycolate phosphatase [Ralstonia pseudosolanacearum]AMP38249.1 phosphoglycolate phosphatase [Ralstonia solanacearum]AXV77649.1 phosphoglycolate phosphatase [Ralstonia solanacearum]AXV87077.1 phosphoglycolate phosphatase [Ralstonia solanacearum]AXV91671.1 phosphoglycolate phosphatase [Ralstonia solanacearum]